MLQDINRISNFLRSDDGKHVRNRIICILCIAAAFLLINRFVLIPYVSDDYKIAFNQSKLLFKNGLSPYESENQNLVIRLAEEEGWNVKNNFRDLGNPIYQFIFFIPFTIIKNYQWSEALFMTVNQLCIVLVIHMLFNLLRWDPKLTDRIIIYFLSSSIFFVVNNLFSANISILQFTFLIGVLYYDEKDNHILSGILYGLSFIDPIGMFYAQIVVSLILFNRKKYSIFIWGFITITLLTLFSFIYNNNWVLGWLSSLFLSPSRYPFITFIEAVEMKYNFQIHRIFTVVPIFLITWLIFEILRTPKDEIEKNIWLFSIGGILNYYLLIQPDSGSEILFFPAMILLIGIWWEKIKDTSKFVLFVFLALISYGVIGWQLFGSGNMGLQNNELILFLLGIFLVINLYWIRVWVVNPYEVKDKDTKFL